MLKGRQRKLETEFTFAGFNFPKYLSELPKGSKKQCQERYKHTGGYYSAPTPNANGFFCYLDSDFANPIHRWKWCDEVSDASISHTGWYTNEYGDSAKIRGIVIRLNHDRGFIVGWSMGWSMGEGMATSVETDHIYDDEVSAAYAADSLAEDAAEKEREYQEEQERLQDEEDEREEACLGGDEEETLGY